MTAPGSTPNRPSALARYGPLVAIVVAVAVVTAIIVVGGRDDEQTAAPPATVGTAGSSAVPQLYSEAQAAGTADATTWVDNCDPQTGRIEMPTVYAPPCVPAFSGDNGGATSLGVTADTIKVVTYIPADNGDLLSLLASNLDPPEAAAATRNAYVEMFSDLYETYGRRIELVDYNGSGAADDEVAAAADAQAVIDLAPFASIGGPALTPAYAERLADAGIMCLGCGLANPDAFAQAHAPFIWGPTPTAEEFLVNVGDYVVERLNNKPAEFAGDPALQGETRRFGVVNFEQDPPVFAEVGEQVRQQGKERGWESVASETYVFDIGKMPERATTIVTKMKEAGVTSIIFLGDPIMPIYLTKAATEQNYFPEWIVTGTVLTDTAVLSRRYDPQQWAHAFGLSNLPVRMPREQVEPWRLHEWYFGTPPEAKNTNAIIFPNYALLMLGIHLAGPDLTPETFRDGLFHYPPSGGGPTAPQISYGDQGYFELLDGSPRLDYQGIDDVVEIWWDPEAEGPDEQGNVAPGMWRYANGGRRYLPGQMTTEPASAFDPDGALTILDAPPPEDQAPTYPSPRQG